MLPGFFAELMRVTLAGDQLKPSRNLTRHRQICTIHVPTQQ